jgi:uncharacterized membrane protein
MKTRRFSLLDVATVVMTVVILAMALWVAMRAPDVAYPMHFNARGEPDRWGDRNELAVLLGFMAIMTAITAGMTGWYAESAEDAARRRSLRMGQMVSLVSIGGVTGLILWFTVGAMTNGEPPAIGWAMAVTGLILALVGSGLGRVGPNAVVGVRTPWSYKSRLAWDRSNRLAGRLFFWIGLSLILAAPIASQPAASIAMVVLILVAAIWPVFESWRVWRSDPDRQPF